MEFAGEGWAGPAGDARRAMRAPGNPKWGSGRPKWGQPPLNPVTAKPGNAVQRKKRAVQRKKRNPERCSAAKKMLAGTRNVAVQRKKTALQEMAQMLQNNHPGSQKPGNRGENCTAAKKNCKCNITAWKGSDAEGKKCTENL